MRICVLGAGAWGTALAVNAAARHAVRLWSRDPAQARAQAAARQNARYLPGALFPPTLEPCSGAPLRQAEDADLIVLAAPMAALRGLLQMVNALRSPVVWLCKGVEPVAAGGDWGLLGHEIHQQVAPALHVGVLSGPSFAQEVAQGRPTALVAASEHEAVRNLLVEAFHGPALRVYASDDVVGVEVGGAVKNVLAIATGMADGLDLGLNARAALITRGLAEMTRLGMALGARTDTFMGLSGLGDLVLTATGDLSRNRKVGLQMAAGQTLAQAVASLGHVAEGVYCARSVVERARRVGIEMPIAECVVAVLDGRLQAAEAVGELMRREPGAETLAAG